MPCRVESDENKDKEHFDENTDCRAMQVNFDDEKGMKKKKEGTSNVGKKDTEKKQPLIETESLTTVELMARLVSVLMILKMKSKNFIFWRKLSCSPNRHRLQHH